MRYWLDALATAAMLVTCAVLLWAAWPKRWPPPPPVTGAEGALVSVENASVKGSAEAEVVVLVWSDYQCPYCARADRVLLPALEARFVATGRIQMAVLHNPLEDLHPRAAKAAEAALCARVQGRFWEMHRALFEAPDRLDDAGLMQQAMSVGLDPVPFEDCLAGDMRAQVQDDQDAAARLGLTWTPAFAVGRRDGPGSSVVRVVSVLKPRHIDDFETAIAMARAGWWRSDWVLPGAASAVAVVGIWVNRRWRLKRGKPA